MYVSTFTRYVSLSFLEEIVNPIFMDNETS